MRQCGRPTNDVAERSGEEAGLCMQQTSLRLANNSLGSASFIAKKKNQARAAERSRSEPPEEQDFSEYMRRCEPAEEKHSNRQQRHLNLLSDIW